MNMITVWKDGSWKVWNKEDAYYAANDEDWMVNVDLDICIAEREEMQKSQE